MNRRLHITSGRGPQECCWVVFQLVRQVLHEARQCGLRAELLESVSWCEKK
jgi:peptide chain release factor